MIIMQVWVWPLLQLHYADWFLDLWKQCLLTFYQSASDDYHIYLNPYLNSDYSCEGTDIYTTIAVIIVTIKSWIFSYTPSKFYII